LSLWVILWAAGCEPLDNVDPDGDGFSVDQGDCAPLDPAVYPGEGDCPEPAEGGCGPFPASQPVSGPWDGHYAGAPVEVGVAGVSEPTLTLEHEGQDLAGTWVDIGTTAWQFVPVEPLAPATTYTWAIRSSAGCEDRTFTTSNAGLPVQDPAAIVGRVFEVAVDQRYTDWTYWLFFEPPFWVRIDEVQGEVAHVTLAPTQPPGSTALHQYTCEPTVSVEGTWDGARLRLAGPLLPLPVGLLSWSANNEAGVDPPQTIPLEDWSLELVIHPDGTTTTVDHFDVTADTRSLGAFFVVGNGNRVPGSGEPTNFCDLADTLLPVACEPCDDELVTCAPMELVGHDTAGGLAPGTLVHIGEGEQENRLCEGACDNGTDDDADTATDTDPECDALWP